MTKTLLLLPLLAAGCATMPDMPKPTGPCRVGESVRMRFVGTNFRMAMREEVAAATNAPIARVLRPGDVTTMEFNPNRLTIHVDDMKRIDGLTCG